MSCLSAAYQSINHSVAGPTAQKNVEKGVDGGVDVVVCRAIGRPTGRKKNVHWSAAASKPCRLCADSANSTDASCAACSTVASVSPAPGPTACVFLSPREKRASVTSSGLIASPLLEQSSSSFSASRRALSLSGGTTAGSVSDCRTTSFQCCMAVAAAARPCFVRRSAAAVRTSKWARCSIGKSGFPSKRLVVGFLVVVRQPLTHGTEPTRGRISERIVLERAVVTDRTRGGERTKKRTRPKRRCESCLAVVTAPPPSNAT
jgi:hypothetical protein